MILYFSATGNSEYIAKYIGYLNNDEVINITDYLKQNKEMNFHSNTPYLVVCPIYLSTIPSIIFKALITAKLEGNKNIYFIMTCAGSGTSAAAVSLKKIAKKLNMNYRGVEHLSMPQDYLIFFKVSNEQANNEKMNKALERVPNLAKAIKENKDFNKDKVGLMHKLSIKPVEVIFNGLCIKPKKFYSTKECIGCGLCSKLCPLNNIKIINNKPIWGKKCIHCTACINHCPKQAIEYGKKTIEKNRYVAKKFKAD